MCPICWATALASFTVLIALSVLAVAGSDMWCLSLAVFAGASATLHRTGMATLPWWFFVVLMAMLMLRIAHLLVLRREQLLIVEFWRRACAISASRCRNKPNASEPTPPAVGIN
jgi:hypothetical protein